MYKKSWVVTLRRSDLVLRTYSMNPNPEALVEHLKSNYPGARYESAYEAGFSGFWAHRRLEKMGVNSRVINAASIPTSGSEKSHKNDRIDSKKIARELEHKTVEGLYVPTEQQEAIRSYCRLRQQYAWEMAGQKNRIKSNAYRLGLRLPERAEMGHWSHQFMNYIRGLEYPTQTDKQVMEELLDYHEHQRKTCAEIINKLRKHVSADSEMSNTIRLLMTVPGVGFITAVI